MNHSRAAKDDSAGDVDEVGRGNKIAKSVEERRHGFAREDVAGEEDAWKNGQKRELHGFPLRIGLAGDEDAKDETHESQNERELEETDAQVGEQLAEKQTHWPDGSDEKLFERATLLLADDGKRGEKSGHVE